MASVDSSPHEICFLPVWRAAEWLAQGRASATELVEACRAAYMAGHAQINALVIADFDAAHEAARRSDARRRAGRALGPLDGIPFSIKESFDVAGWATTCGSPAHRNNIATQDALAVTRLRNAGAILLGKTNVPLGLRDWQSYNAIYGTTRNPHDPSRTPGGSSGGSAAAICAGMSFFDVGSDIGSSLRNPAHYCGIFSHKSTHGIVPLSGHGVGGGAVPSDINVAGPLARSATDLALILRALTANDGESAGYRLALPECDAKALRDFRVGMLLTHELADVDAPVQAVLEHLGKHLARQGVAVTWNARPRLDAAALWRTYVLLLRAATSHYLDDANHADACARSADLARDDDSYAVLQYHGTALSHREWLQLQALRQTFCDAWRQLFETVDVLLCPAAATTAFALNEAGEPWQRTLPVNGRAQPMTTQLFWAGHSGLCNLPSTVAPAGIARDGLPVGVQIVAPQFHDHRSLRFAELLEQEGFAFRVPAPQR